jgi:hypothetical protein
MDKAYKFFAKNTKTAQETSKIKEVAEKLGIVLPSTHTAIFQSVYSPIEESNDNGVRLAKDAVENALPGIIGSQANLEHFGYGWIVGIILDAFINDSNEIEIVYTFAKNIYSEEYIKAVEKMEKGELTVSFELYAMNGTTESLSDGTIRVNDIDFQGVGILLDSTPAYKNAITYEMASTYKARAEKEGKEMVLASKIVENCDHLLSKYYDYGVTSGSDHFHVFVMDSEGKGETLATFGFGVEDHKHEIVDGGVQATNEHVHSIYDYILWKEVNDTPEFNMGNDWSEKFIESLKTQAEIRLVQYTDLLKLKTNSNVQRSDNKGEIKKMEFTDEQKQLVAELREELGSLATDISDEDLLNEEKVAELRKAKEDELKAQEEASELEKAQARIAELEQAVEELNATIEAKNSEIEEVRVNAEKIGKLKVELKDNQYCADFKEEDYLDEQKVAQAKLQKENDELKARLEEAEKAREKKTASAEEDNKKNAIETGDPAPEGSDLRSIYRKLA